MNPLIGITPLHNPRRGTLWIHPDYCAALEAAGALPVLLPLTDDAGVLRSLASRLDGLLLSGGHDVDPALYGEELLPCCGPLSPAKDRMERAILEQFLRLDKPVLALCRGMQLLNVHLGGSLYQDLPTQFPTRVVHNQPPPYHLPVHAVSVVPGGLLHTIVGREQLAVNSYHHQAVREAASALSVQARAPDGLAEALALPGARFVLGLQWHPENLFREDECSAAVFTAFLDACRTSK